MYITGTTQHRLDLVKSYDPNNPYIVGTNGVTDVIYNTDGSIKSVKYNIGGIEYTTEFTIKVTGPAVKQGTKVPNLNRSGNIRQLPSEYLEPTDVIYPTTFRYSPSTITETDYYIFKDESKMGVVFTPKVEDEVFIERQVINTFEIQSRLSEINSLDELEDYNNGFYNIQNIE